jgi:hypothetical protein
LYLTKFGNRMSTTWIDDKSLNIRILTCRLLRLSSEKEISVYSSCGDGYGVIAERWLARGKRKISKAIHIYIWHQNTCKQHTYHPESTHRSKNKAQATTLHHTIHNFTSF